MRNIIFVIFSLTILSACTTITPKNTENICEIFQEKEDWYDATLNSSRRWGIPIAIQMAIIHQESRFVADAEPPNSLILGFIPWFGTSSAYGYPQAKDETWSDYQQKTHHHWANREDFADSSDFVAWYCSISHKKLGISPADGNNLYLTYHEGLAGFQHNTHQNKPWLLKTAQKVHQRALRYDQQLSTCRPMLDSKN